jgi:hypothetical protein
MKAEGPVVEEYKHPVGPPLLWGSRSNWYIMDTQGRQPEPEESFTKWGATLPLGEFNFPQPEN